VFLKLAAEAMAEAIVADGTKRKEHVSPRETENCPAISE
jgi:hypothetical protein